MRKEIEALSKTNIREQLPKIRKELNLSQQDVASSAGLARHSVHAIEAGKANARQSTVDKIKKAIVSLTGQKDGISVLMVQQPEDNYIQIILNTGAFEKENVDIVDFLPEAYSVCMKEACKFFGEDMFRNHSFEIKYNYSDAECNLPAIFYVIDKGERCQHQHQHQHQHQQPKYSAPKE